MVNKGIAFYIVPKMKTSIEVINKLILVHIYV